MGLALQLITFVLSIVCGLCGSVALAVLADRLHWCCVNGWAQLHDTGPAVFLLVALAGYHLVSAIGAKTGHLPPSWPPGWLAHTAYVASALGTVWSINFVPSRIAALGGLGPNYGWVVIGLIAASLGVLLKIRGRRVGQFGIIIASLIVSCYSVVVAAGAEWMMRHL